MIAALLLSVSLSAAVPASCDGRRATLERVVSEAKGMPAYAGARNAAFVVMETGDFLAEMGLYHGRQAQRVLAFADPPMFLAFVRVDYLCVATEPELLQTVMHELGHLVRPSWSEKQVDDYVHRNWPRRIGPPTADPTPRMQNWRSRNGR